MKKLFILILCGLFSVIVSKVGANDSIYTYAGMMRGTTIKPVQKYKVNYSENYADMSMYSSTECQYSDLYFYVYETTEKEGPGAPVKNNPTGSLNMYSDDFCTGGYSHGNAEIELSTFEVDKNLDKAHAQGTGTLYTWEYESRDDTSPDYIVKPISIEVTWTGLGDLYKGHYRSRERMGTTIYTSNSNGSSREAQARGSITDDMTPIELVSNYAYIQNVKQGYMMMEKIHKNK
jgi:hypothetical protein